MLSLMEMSIIGAILITVIIVLRALAVNRMPKKAFLVLWAVALVRLILPFRIASPVSIYRAAGDDILKNTPDWNIQGQGFRPLLITGDEVFKTEDRLSFLLLVWIAGLILLALYFVITHLRSRRDYQASLPVENKFVKGWMDTHRLRRPVQVRYSDQIEAPLTYGILWPVLLLPKSINWKDEETLGFILAHELSHIRRFDALTKWIYAAVLCIHWFNPLVWAMYVLANRDLELSCDETVIRQYGMNAKSSYALALVSLEQKRSCATPLTSSFSKLALKERIIAIMNSRPLTVKSIIAACGLIGITIALFATTAPSGNSGTQADANSQPLSEQGEGNPSLEDYHSSQLLVQNSTIPKIPETKDNEYDFYGFEEEDNKYGEKNELNYTKEQYDRLIAALNFPDYKDMSIAEFNRRVNAALSDENGKGTLRQIYENVMYSIPEDDPKADYLVNTVQLSIQEYNTRMEEVYSGEKVDHEYYGNTSIAYEGEIFGDPVIIRWCEASYCFTYRILDQDKLTVRERDDFLQKMILAAHDILEQAGTKEMTKEAYKEELEKWGSTLSTEKIEFTGCEIHYLEFY